VSTASLSTMFMLISSESESANFFVRHNGRCARCCVLYFYGQEYASQTILKTKQPVGRVFSRYFARIRRQNRVLTPLRSASKRHARPQPSASLCIPNEDLGKRNSRSGVSFRCTLRGCEFSIWATNARKITRKDTPDLLFRFPKSSFGEYKVPSATRPLFLDNLHFGQIAKVSTTNPG